MDGSAARDGGERLLGLDVGSRRVGVALAGEVAGFAEPLFTMERRGDRQDVKSVGRLVRKHGVTAVVVGHPLRLSGEASAQTVRVERFAEALRAEIGVPVYLHDERLSTVAAHEHLDGAGHGERGRAGVIDQVAAVVILEGFLLHRAHREAVARVRAEDAAATRAEELP